MDLFSTRVVVSERKFHNGAICKLRTDWVWIQPWKISTSGPSHNIILTYGRCAHGHWHTYGDLCTRHYKAMTVRLVFTKTIACLKTTERCPCSPTYTWESEHWIGRKVVKLSFISSQLNPFDWSDYLVWPLMSLIKRRNKVNQLIGVPTSWMGLYLS